MFDDVKDSLMLIFGSILIILCFGSMVTCSYYHSEAKELSNDIALKNEQNEALKQKYTAETKALELKYKEQERLAYENFAEELQKISDNSNTNQRLIDRVQYHTTETIKYMPDMERSTLEKNLKAYAEQLVKSAALLADIDRISREYDAELELCLTSYPKPPLGQDSEE